MPPLIDLKGRRFGRLVVLRRSSKHGVRTLWECLCDCGNQKTMQGGNLVNGVSQSCGCLQREGASRRFTTHGMSKSHAYQNWQAMMRRCYEPSQPSFKNYGARGIHIDGWWHSFGNFLSDMGEAPSGMTLERRDNDGPYSKDNCVWATRAEQSLNKRTNRLLTYNGQTKVAAVWARELGVNPQVVYTRLHRGWPVERVLALPKVLAVG